MLVQLVQLVQLPPTLTLVRALFQPHVSRMRQDLSVSAPYLLFLKISLFIGFKAGQAGQAGQALKSLGFFCPASEG